MKEIFKDIPNYEGIYQISNLGTVKSLKFGKEKILKASIDSKGYYLLKLSKNNIKINYNIHQLVAITFLNHTPCGYKLVINHKDLNKLNNNIDNLELVTARENINFKRLKRSSQYDGVSWCKSSKKWLSRIWIARKRFHLGYFTNEYDAHLAYQNKLKELQK